MVRTADCQEDLARTTNTSQSYADQAEVLKQSEQFDLQLRKDPVLGNLRNYQATQRRAGSNFRNLSSTRRLPEVQHATQYLKTH